MPYILDTDVVIDLLAQDSHAVEFIAKLVPEWTHMSTITFMEAYEGTMRAAEPDEMRSRIMALADRTVLLPFGPQGQLSAPI